MQFVATLQPLHKGHMQNTYAQLPKVFFSELLPTAVANPQGLLFNHKLAFDLGLTATLEDKKITDFNSLFLDWFSGNTVDKKMKPLAQAYAGHQFGHFTKLGDGRALLLSEIESRNKKIFDIHLKGSGPTPYSRRGDGRAALGPMLREYIISEAMHHLGVPTTRSLAVISTGESVYREAEFKGAILTRIASSHIRVGTFEYAHAFTSKEELTELAKYAIQRHDPDLSTDASGYYEFFKRVCLRQADLIALWMKFGFIHGVMNTDNMTVSGETIDYGPCAFIDEYKHNKVFSSIDRQGRYAYSNQPSIGYFNLSCLAESFLPLLSDKTEAATLLAQQALEMYKDRFQKQWLIHMKAKLGLQTENENDLALVSQLFEIMNKHNFDFTNTFLHLMGDTEPPYNEKNDEFKNWLSHWQKRLALEKTSDSEIYRRMKKNNPYRIARNHQVEKALIAAEAENNIEPTFRLIQALEKPFENFVEYKEYQLPPNANERIEATFCGT